MSGNILEMKNVSKSFGVVKALSEVSLEIRQGEIHALCGENGAGKSTLMKILGGFWSYGNYEGEMYLDDSLCKFHSPKDSIDCGIAMIYQEINILKFMTVADNLFAGEFPVRRGVVDNKQLNKNAVEILKLLDLDISPKAIAGSLSASHQQLLMIGNALIRNPKVLILDEPTSALTLIETDRLLKILENLKEKGVTCIFISHRLEEVMRIADRVTVLRDGSSVGTFERGEFDISRIVSTMVGRKMDDFYPKRDQEIGKTVFEVKGLSVPDAKIRKKCVVDDVSFTLKQSEVLGIAGLVGAGRSEILNAIYGYLPKRSGEMKICGKTVKINSPADSLKNGIGLVTEERKAQGIFEDCNIAENITSASIYQVAPRMFIRKQLEKKIAESSVEKFSIKTPSIRQLIQKLSGGNQQKTILAKVLLTNPIMLMLDEPTRGIDVGSKYEIYALMNQLVAEGVSIIMVSSELPELIHMCDRIVVVASGRITGEFSKHEVSEEKIMLAATTSQGKGA